MVRYCLYSKREREAVRGMQTFRKKGWKEITKTRVNLLRAMVNIRRWPLAFGYMYKIRLFSPAKWFQRP